MLADCRQGCQIRRKGINIANTLTPNVGDANSQTPEYKAFLVNIEKA
ncbi:formate dehydrogenase [Salmonella enterica]|nr:formate dehydrogenase [Salmonella enterica]EBI2066220.1 formate dehydrogenase [Salmonella enterica]